MYALILAALLAWSHGTVPRATLEPWAGAMASVCTSERECLLLAAQAWVESRFAAPVLSGDCNRHEWRAQQRGWWRKACDGGLAVGAWQAHGIPVGSSPEFQASYALTLMRRCPTCWTTWRVARAQAGWWLGRSGHGT